MERIRIHVEPSNPFEQEFWYTIKAPLAPRGTVERIEQLYSLLAQIEDIYEGAQVSIGL